MEQTNSRPSSNNSRPPSITRHCRDNFVASFESLPPESPVQNELNEEVVDLDESHFERTADVLVNAGVSISSPANSSASKDDNEEEISRPNSKDSSSSQPESEIESKIRKGMKKIERLDNILAKKVKKEKQVKKERRQFEKEFKSEVENLIKEKGKTNIYGSEQLLALCNATSDTKHDNVVYQTEPIFSTQIDPKYYENHYTEKNPEKKNGKLGSPEKKNKSKTDFVNRNIELVSNATDGVLMTEEEKERLDQLLADDTGLLFVENPFSTQAITDTAYAFSEVEIESLKDIDMKLKQLVPEKDVGIFGLENESPSEAISPVGDNKTDMKDTSNFTEVGDSLMDISHFEVDCGEKVLQEKRDERTLNKRLKDIDEELKKLKLLDEEENTPKIDPDLLLMLLDNDSRLTSDAVSISESVSSRTDLLSFDATKQIPAH